MGPCSAISCTLTFIKISQHALHLIFFAQEREGLFSGSNAGGGIRLIEHHRKTAVPYQFSSPLLAGQQPCQWALKKSKRAMPYWICIAIGALIFAGVASMRSIWTLSEREEILSGLCDALFVPGALLTCVGLLTFTAREGVLDIISYGFRNLLVLFAPGKHKHLSQ